MQLRRATADDVDELRGLIDASVRGLQAADYTGVEIDRALATVYGVDTTLIADGTYFVVDADGQIVGCGGWSRRATLFGGDQYAAREDSFLDPARDAAKIRAFFVHPRWARRGIGTLILDACENAARAAGFVRCEMGATLTGVPFYAARGYTALDRLTAPFAIVHMEKSIVRQIRVAIGSERLLASLEVVRAPVTCAAFLRLLPLRAKLIQARWSGEAAWVPLGTLDVGVGEENAMHEPQPGQLLLYPAGASETEILVPYGITAFAAKVGPLKGNHFLTIEHGVEQLAAIGRRVLWEGAQDIVFEVSDGN